MKEGKSSVTNETQLKHHSRRISIKEGIFWSIRVSFGDKFVAPFAIAAGMSDAFVAILNSIWQLNPVGQIFGSKRINKDNKKKFLTSSFAFESLGWFMVFVTSLLYLLNFSTNFITISLAISMLIVVLAAGAEYPAWFSLMGDVVDTKFRGRWWGKRATIISFTTIIFSIISAFTLNFFEANNLKLMGFVFFFFIAFVSRTISMILMRKLLDKKTKVDNKNNSIKTFLKELTKTNFGKFTLYRGIFGIAMGITASLVPIYLLRNLGLGYVPYILITLSGTIFSVITLNLWGKLADSFGNYKIIAITSMLIPFTPLLYILSSNPFYLFIFPGLIGGTSWTAFVLVSKNFIYDNVKKENIGKYVSYYNLFLGFGTFVGGMIGSVLITLIKTTWIQPMVLIFIIGTILRIIIALFWVPKIHETRIKSKASTKMKFENIFIREIKPTMVEDLHDLEAIPKYLKEK